MARCWDRRYGWHPTHAEYVVIMERAGRKLEQLVQRALRRRAMSWSASASSVVARDAVGTLRASFAATYPTPTAEVDEQFAAAIRAVEGALTVVQPDLDGLVTVSVSGHANPGHQKAAGWANDSFTVSIYQL